MASVVNIVVTADDRASKQLGRVGAAAESLSGKLKAARIPLLAITGVLAGAGFASIKLASNLEESRAAAETTFGGSIGIVNKFATETADAFNVTTSAAFEYTAQLGAIFKASGLTEEAAAAQSVEFTKLAADLASFKNLRFEDALQKIRAGLVGEAEPLRTVGVLLSSARVQQVAYARGIAETGAQLTEAQKVAARQIIIMEDLADAQGDVARTSGSVANMTKDVLQQLSDLGAEIGTILLPITAQLLSVLAKMLGFFRDIPQPLQQFGVVMAIVVAGLGMLALALPPVIGLVATLGITFGIALAGIPLLIGAIVAGIVLLIMNWDTVVEAVRKAVNFVIPLIEHFVNAHLIGFNLIIKAINLVLEFLGQKAIPEIRLQLGRWEKSIDQVAVAQGQAADEIAMQLSNIGGEYVNVADLAVGSSVRIVAASEESAEKLVSASEETADRLQQIDDFFFAERLRKGKEKADQILADRAEAERELTELIIEQEAARAEAQQINIDETLARAREMAGILPDVFGPGVGTTVQNTTPANSFAGGFISADDRADQLGLTGEARSDFIARQNAAQGRLLRPFINASFPGFPGMGNPQGLLDDARLRVSGETGVGGVGGATIVNIFQGPVTRDGVDMVEQATREAARTGR